MWKTDPKDHIHVYTENMFVIVEEGKEKRIIRVNSIRIHCIYAGG
jgi:hypothetical protein